MANPDRPVPDSLIEEIAKNFFAYDFFRAVRLLECRHPELPRIGHSFSPSQDPIRFGQKPSLTFSPSTLEALAIADNGVPKVFANFFGLFGPHGPLPLHLTEYAYERERHFDDPTITGFFNLFHHRLFSFFYRAWAANQKAIDLDRLDEQRFALYLGSFFGVGMEGLQDRDAVSDSAKLYYSGRLACQTRNAEGLEAIIGDFFDVPTEVEAFSGRWLDLPPDCHCKLGLSPDTGSLGLTSIVGSRLWDCQLSFRIRMGPLSLADYERMLPSGKSFERLKYWVLNYLDVRLTWDVQLVLRAEEVPAISLGGAGQLGWTTWLKTREFTRDADDLILIPPL